MLSPTSRTFSGLLSKILLVICDGDIVQYLPLVCLRLCLYIWIMRKSRQNRVTILRTWKVYSVSREWRKLKPEEWPAPLNLLMGPDGLKFPKLCNRYEGHIRTDILFLTWKRGSSELEVTGKILVEFIFPSARPALWTVPALKLYWCWGDFTVATEAWAHKTSRRETFSLAGRNQKKRSLWSKACGQDSYNCFLPPFSCGFTPRADGVTQKCARF